MLKRNGSVNDLKFFCYSCVLFRKYYQYDLWLGSFGEYNNIKYCRKYIQLYMYWRINIFLLQRFNFFVIVLLYKSFGFVKFVESGVFKYFDYHFLLLFYNNCFSFDLKGKYQIKVFVNLYFQNFVKKRLEKEILLLVIKVMDEIIPDTLLKHLTIRLKSLDIYAGQIKLSDKDLAPSEIEKKNFNFLGLFNFHSLVKTGYSRNINILSSFYVLDYDYCLITSINNKKTLKSNFKPVKSSNLVTEEKFIGVSQNILGSPNQNIFHLVGACEFLDKLIVKQKSIGLYKNHSILLKKPLVQAPLLINKSFKNKLVFKRFINYFVKYRYKRKFNLKSYKFKKNITGI